MTRSRERGDRAPQLAYSELQYKTHDERKRRRKAAKIVAVLDDFLGADDLAGLTAVDIGCSTGFTAEALRRAGAQVVGLDIDVPGLVHANEKFGRDVAFLCADGSALPFADRSIDILVFNHIYEHVVDADAVMAEIARVVSADGVAYFGFGNRLAIIEPHYRLPFLSWLPRPVADRYVRTTGRARTYYEQFRTRRSLLKMCAGLNVWDYTYTVLTNSRLLAAQDMVPKRLSRAPGRLWHLAAPIMPTFIWLGTPSSRRPASAVPSERPVQIATLSTQPGS